MIFLSYAFEIVQASLFISLGTSFFIKHIYDLILSIGLYSQYLHISFKVAI